MNTIDVLNSSLNVYQEKLKKLIAKRDNEIAIKVKELSDELRENLYKKEISDLQEIIANFYLILEKEVNKGGKANEDAKIEVETNPVETEIENVPNINTTNATPNNPNPIKIKEVVVENKKPLFKKNNSDNAKQVGRKGIKFIANPKRR